MKNNSEQNVSSLKDFEVLNKLGEGAFSSVYKARRISDNQYYALKKVKLGSLNQKEKENSLNEVRILASINHQNIVSYKECFIDEKSNILCLVLEFCDGGDILNKVKDYIKKRKYFSEEELWKYASQMISALECLHSQKILHRDLKCANVFMTKEGDVKLGDLNVSKVAKKGLVQTQTGTPYYASPEVWSDKPYDSKSDIWSLGCVLYEMAALKPPFRAQDMQSLYRKVIRGIYDPLPKLYSTDFQMLISSCLKVQPSLRPSVEQLSQNPLLNQHFHKQTSSNGLKVNLLQTIKVPINLKALKYQLPKAQYDDQMCLKLPEKEDQEKIKEKIQLRAMSAKNSKEIQQTNEVKELNQRMKMEKPALPLPTQSQNHNDYLQPYKYKEQEIQNNQNPNYQQYAQILRPYRYSEKSQIQQQQQNQIQQQIENRPEIANKQIDKNIKVLPPIMNQKYQQEVQKQQQVQKYGLNPQDKNQNNSKLYNKNINQNQIAQQKKNYQRNNSAQPAYNRQNYDLYYEDRSKNRQMYGQNIVNIYKNPYYNYMQKNYQYKQPVWWG